MSYLWDNKHFIITHFPIVLLLFSFLFDLAALTLKKREWHAPALICLLAGTLGAIFAVLTGPSMPMPNSGVETHEMYGKLTMALAIVLSVIRGGILLWKKIDIGRYWLTLIASLAAVVLVMYTAHLGGKMVHRPIGEGPGGFGQFQGQFGDGGGFGQGQGQQGQGGGQGQGQGRGPGAQGGQNQGGGGSGGGPNGGSNGGVNGGSSGSGEQQP